MKLRRLTAILMLAVYLFSICGYAVVILACHCPSSRHYHEKHICQHGCMHHAEQDGINAPTCGCHHKHTTDVELYDKAKRAQQFVAPIVCESLETEPTTDIFVTEIRLDCQRKVPIQSSPRSTCRALRAPPVFA